MPVVSTDGLYEGEEMAVDMPTWREVRDFLNGIEDSPLLDTLAEVLNPQLEMKRPISRLSLMAREDEEGTPIGGLEIGASIY